MIEIFAAKMGGYVSYRFGQPSVLGELLVGVISGSTILNMVFSLPLFHEPVLLQEALTLLAELGVIMLMFLAGLALHLSELLTASKVSIFSGVLGVLVPLGLGYGTAILFGVKSTEALFIALTISATSVSISAQTLMEPGVLRTRLGLGLLGGFNRRQAMQLGIGMVSRGEVGLIVATFALSEGLLSSGNFSIVYS
ncbi:MAG: cation:proton antiporter [Candidatus Promineifilaceae bacterium]